MEILNVLKFWKSNNAKLDAGSYVEGSVTVDDSVIYDPLTEESDDDDSFFELELTLPSYDSKFPKIEPCSKASEQQIEKSESFHSSDSRPQSPVSVLRSPSPKLRIFMFGKFGRKQKRDDSETESVSSNLSPRKSNSSLFTVKFNIEDGSIVPKISRSNSSGLFSPKPNSEDCSESSKRFSKDVLQKYFNLIRPSFAKSSKVKCKHLGKSKSASSIIVSPSPARNDDSLDGIEGAILHCKRSLTSSAGHSSLSRCSSDPSHEKSVQVSGEI